MKIEILGVGCPKCKQLAANVELAVSELNIAAEVIKVDNIEKILEYGIILAPALVIDGNIVSTGKVLSKEDIKKILG